MMPTGTVVFICRDAEETRYLAEQVALRDTCKVAFYSLVRDGVLAVRQRQVDVIVADFEIPEIDAALLIREIKDRDKDAIIIGLRGAAKPAADSAVVGAYEVLHFPVDVELLMFVIRKGMDQRKALAVYQRALEGLQERNAAIEKQNILLVQRIEDSARSLARLYENQRATYLHTIKVLAQAIDARDHYTHSHSENVITYATAIAREMGYSAKDVEMISDACQLHDLGKIGVEDNILSKVTPLTEEEWAQIKRHPVTGAQILKPLTFLQDIVELVRQHHEHYDGSGYPDGRKGDDIHPGARIIHLADAYEAMRSARSYRKVPLSKDAAVHEIKRHSGTQFDPKVVEAFLAVLNKVDTAL